MKRASYRQAIEWVALNDCAGDDDALDVEVTRGLTTAVLIADLFGVDDEKVGRDIVKARKTLLASK